MPERGRKKARGSFPSAAFCASSRRSVQAAHTHGSARAREKRRREELQGVLGEAARTRHRGGELGRRIGEVLLFSFFFFFVFGREAEIGRDVCTRQEDSSLLRIIKEKQNLSRVEVLLQSRVGLVSLLRGINRIYHYLKKQREKKEQER